LSPVILVTSCCAIQIIVKNMRGRACRNGLLCCYFAIQSSFRNLKIIVRNHNEHLETLTEIRSMMERSSRFISLSGLSGVAAGSFALLGATLVYVYLGLRPFSNYRIFYAEVLNQGKWGIGYETFFVLVAAAVFLLAVSSGIYFTTRKARRKGQKVWDKSAFRMITNLAIPLFVGGIFCLVLYREGQILLIAPATLVFYGLALVNGSKYTLDDIRYLGFCELGLGIIGLFFPGYGLELWAIGFGILHIVYGLVMYRKYE
jgi:hypothetical protein